MVKQQPKVSVIIPVYNVENFLGECLESVVNQTLKEIEIICVNDGSTDQSLAILKKYSQKDERISVINQENRGLSAARNSGSCTAKGKYLYFLDSDDYIDRNALKDLFISAENDNLDVIFFDMGAFIEDESLQINHDKLLKHYDRKFNFTEITTGKDLFAKMVLANEFRTNVVLQFINRSFYEKIGLSFFEGIIHEDNLFSFLCILQADRVRYLPKIYYHRRIREDSIMTRAIGANNFKGYFTCFIHMLTFVIRSDYEGNVLDAIKIHLQKMYDHSYSLYLQLTDSERLSLNWSPETLDEFLFTILIDKRRSKEIELTNLIDVCKNPPSLSKKVKFVSQYLKQNGIYKTFSMVISHVGRRKKTE